MFHSKGGYYTGYQVGQTVWGEGTFRGRGCVNGVRVVKLKTKSLRRLPCNMRDHLLTTSFIRLQAGRRPIIRGLGTTNIRFRDFSSVCRSGSGFSSMCHRVTSRLLRGTGARSLVCTMPKRPLITRSSIGRLLRGRTKVRIRVIKKGDFVSSFFRTMTVSPVRNFRLISKLAFRRSRLDLNGRLVVVRIFGRFITDSMGLGLVRGCPSRRRITLISTTKAGVRGIA